MDGVKNIFKINEFIPNNLFFFISPNFLLRYPLYRAIKKNQESVGGVMLDFGCGSKPYKNVFSNKTNYIGVDIETTGHDHTTSDVDVFYDGYTLPFSDNYFDSVFSSEVFEHVFNLEDVLNEINRTLKKGSTLLFTIPFCIGEHEEPFDFGRYTSYGIHDLLNKTGFNVEKIVKINSYFQTILLLMAGMISDNLTFKNKFINLFFYPLKLALYFVINLLGTLMPVGGYRVFTNMLIVATKE